MSNLLKFLLAVSLLICVFFSIALIFGCDENVEKNPKCSDSIGYFYDKYLNKCVYSECLEDKFIDVGYPEDYVECGCFHYHKLYCIEDRVTILILTDLQAYTK